GMIERVVGRLRIDVGYAVYFSNWFASLFILCFFFFSSRRRHTRCLSDWSSDVCSSDLAARSKRSSNSPVRHVFDRRCPAKDGRAEAGRSKVIGGQPHRPGKVTVVRTVTLDPEKGAIRTDRRRSMTHAGSGAPFEDGSRETALTLPAGANVTVTRAFVGAASSASQSESEFFASTSAAAAASTSKCARGAVAGNAEGAVGFGPSVAPLLSSGTSTVNG